MDGVGFEPTNFVEDQIYSLAPLTARPPVHLFASGALRPPTVLPENSGAGGGSRTHDLLITNQLLYQLSYASVSAAAEPSLERGTGLEPATNSLEGCDSTN